MDTLKKLLIILFLLWLFALASGGILHASAQGHENAKEASKTSNGYWESTKSAINQLQMRFFPPDLDFRSIIAPSDKGINEDGEVSAGETVKQAAAKGFQTGTETVAESAKSAAGVVGEAAHLAAEKVKKTVSVDSDQDSHNSEL